MSVIIPNIPSSGESFVSGNGRIGYTNFLGESFTVVNVDKDISNAPALWDNMTTILWNPGSGTATLVASFTADVPVDWVGVAGGNWQSAGASIEVLIDGVSKGTISGMKDGEPGMLTFDEVITDSITVVFTSTSNLFVGECGVGRSLRFPCLPDVGLALGQWSNTDQITTKLTDDAVTGASSVVKRARETNARYSFLPHDWMRSDWEPFSDNHKGKVIWYQWNDLEYPDEVIFGHWQANAPSYDRSTFSAVNLKITGLTR